MTAPKPAPPTIDRMNHYTFDHVRGPGGNGWTIRTGLQDPQRGGLIESTAQNLMVVRNKQTAHETVMCLRAAYFSGRQQELQTIGPVADRARRLWDQLGLPSDGDAPIRAELLDCLRELLHLPT